MADNPMHFRRRTKIGDCNYTIDVLDGVEALDSFGTLAKYLSGPLGHLLAAKMAGAEPEPALVSAAFAQLGSALAEPDMKVLLYKMLEGSTVQAPGVQPQPLIVNGNLEIFKGHFRGKVGQILQLAWFALKENYSSFSEALPGFADLLRQATSQVPASSNSPAATTGGSAG